MVVHCKKCFSEYAKQQDLDRHLEKKFKCDEGAYKCEECWQTFTSQKGLNAHIDNKRCKGPSQALRAHLMAQQMAPSEERMTLLERQVELLSSENEKLSSANEKLRRQLAVVTSDISHIRDKFTFDIEEVHYHGLYLVETYGIVLDEPVSEDHVILKVGRAVEQLIGDRAHDTVKRHPKNRMLYAKRCNDPGEAERRFKRQLKNFNMLLSGSFPDKPNVRAVEFVVFVPDQADQIRSMIDVAASVPARTRISETEPSLLQLQIRQLELANRNLELRA